METKSLVDKYKDRIDGVLHCYDRIILIGTLPQFCYAERMTSYLYCNHIRIFDYPKFAQPFREQIRENAERLAKDNGLTIEFIRKKTFRKEERIKKTSSNESVHATSTT